MKFHESNLNALCLGASFLGSGGGGETKLDAKICKILLKDQQSISILSVDSFDDEALILPIAFIGPLVIHDKMPDLEMFHKILKAVESDHQRPISAIMPGEIGGGNALSAMIASLIHGVPLVDADLIGRAFPELSMCSLSLIPNDIPICAYLSSPKGNLYRLNCVDIKQLERAARQLCILENSSLIMAIYPMTGEQAKKVVIRDSYSQAIQIGKNLIAQNLSAEINYIDEGEIIYLEKAVVDGFLKGYCLLKSKTDTYKISFQNEYLSAHSMTGITVCQSPDIITLMHSDSNKILMTQYLKSGQKLKLFSMRAHDLWYSKTGLSVAAR